MKPPAIFSNTSFQLLAIAAFLGAHCMAPAEPASPKVSTAETAPKGTPKIQFETNFFDLGKLTSVENITGSFKFKNVGNGVLKIDPPQASCDCTEPFVKPDTVAPGESGEVIYIIKLDKPLKGQRMISVHSNDPKNPVVRLMLDLEATPLYELSSKTLWANLAAGYDQTQAHFTITRTDGKPLGVEKFTSSKDWIGVAFDTSFKPEESTAKVNVTVRRPPGPPGIISATLQLWGTNETVRPIQTVSITGEVQGEVAAVPPRLYWVIPDFGKDRKAYPDESLTRKIELVSLLGHEVEIKHAESSIKGMSVEVVPKEAKRKFDLILKFKELPEAFTNGNVTVETSLASLPILEVPMTVAVPGAQ